MFRYPTTADAKRAALQRQSAQSARVYSPWVQRALLGTLPAKEIKR